MTIILDSLHLLNDKHNLDWLPLVLPSKVHIIVSATIGNTPISSDFQNRSKKWRVLQLSPLDLPERKAIIKNRLKLYGKSMTPADVVCFGFLFPIFYA